MRERKGMERGERPIAGDELEVSMKAILSIMHAMSSSDDDTTLNCRCSTGSWLAIIRTNEEQLAHHAKGPVKEG